MFAKYHHLLTTTRTSTAAAAAVGIAVLLVGTDSRETDRVTTSNNDDQ